MAVGNSQAHNVTPKSQVLVGLSNHRSLMDEYENKRRARFHPELNKQVLSFDLALFTMGTGIT